MIFALHIHTKDFSAFYPFLRYEKSSQDNPFVLVYEALFLCTFLPFPIFLKFLFVFFFHYERKENSCILITLDFSFPKTSPQKELEQ